MIPAIPGRRDWTAVAIAGQGKGSSAPAEAEKRKVVIAAEAQKEQTIRIAEGQKEQSIRVAEGQAQAMLAKMQAEGQGAQAVIEIFNHYVQGGFAAYFDRPLPVQAFGRMLEMSRGYPALVARGDDGQVVGFAMLRPFHPAPTLVRTAEVSYFIHPAHRRQGLGERLLERLVEQARARGVDSLVASISSRNEESLAFHRTHGFVERGRLADVGRKFDQDFDVVWMQRRI